MPPLEGLPIIGRHTENPVKVIGRIAEQVKSGRIQPDQLIKDADFLLQIKGEAGREKVKPFLQEAVRRAPEGVIQVALINRLTVLYNKDKKTHKEGDAIRRYIQIGEDLGVTGKLEGQQYIDALKEIYKTVYQPTSQQNGISRRRFLGLAGGFAGAAATGGVIGYALSSFNAPVPKSPDFQQTRAEISSSNSAPIEAAPEKEKAPILNPHLGIRNDILKLMPFVPEFGAKNVRIDGGLSEVSPAGELTDQKNRDLLDVAKKLGLDVLYVFNPQALLSREEIRARLSAILSRDQKITIELGNEPDDVNVPYWKNRNLETFAEFIKIATEEAERIKSAARLVVGALVKQENIKDLVSFLEKKGVNKRKLIYAIHAYHSPDEIWSRAAVVKVATKGAPIMITEAGVAVADPHDVGDIGEDTLSSLVDMYKAGRMITEEPIFIHELPYGQDPITRESFGLVSRETSQPRSDFFVLKYGLNEAEKERFTANTG